MRLCAGSSCVRLDQDQTHDASLAPATKSQESSSAGRAAGGGGQVQQWNDQQWAVIILCGFTLFSIFVAMLIQQVISWGTVSS